MAVRWAQRGMRLISISSEIGFIAKAGSEARNAVGNFRHSDSGLCSAATKSPPQFSTFSVETGIRACLVVSN